MQSHTELAQHETSLEWLNNHYHEIRLAFPGKLIRDPMVDCDQAFTRDAFYVNKQSMGVWPSLQGEPERAILFMEAYIQRVYQTGRPYIGGLGRLGNYARTWDVVPLAEAKHFVLFEDTASYRIPHTYSVDSIGPGSMFHRALLLARCGA